MDQFGLLLKTLFLKQPPPYPITMSQRRSSSLTDSRMANASDSAPFFSAREEQQQQTDNDGEWAERVQAFRLKQHADIDKHLLDLMKSQPAALQAALSKRQQAFAHDQKEMNDCTPELQRAEELVDEISRLLEMAIAETASNDAQRIHWEKMAGDARLCINLARTKYGSSNPELSARLAEAVRNISKFSKANDVTRLQNEYQIAVAERDRLHASIPDMTIYKDLQPAASLLIEPSSSFAAASAAAAAVNKDPTPYFYRARELFARSPPNRQMETRDFGQQADAEEGWPIMLDTLQTVNGRMRQREEADSLEAERQMQQQQAAALRSYNTYDQRDNVDFSSQSSSALNEREQQQQQQRAAAREQSYTDVPSDTTTGLFVATALPPPPAEAVVVVPEQAVAAGLFVAAAAVAPPPSGARPPPPPPPPPGGIPRKPTAAAAAQAAAAVAAPDAAAAAVVPVARRQAAAAAPPSMNEEIKARERKQYAVNIPYNEFLKQFDLNGNEVDGRTNEYTKIYNKYRSDGLLTMEQAAEVKRAVLAAKRAAPPPPAAARRPGPAAAAAMLSVPVDNFKSSNAFQAHERQQAADAEAAELKRALMLRRGGIAPDDVKEGASSNDDEWEDDDGKRAGAPVNPHATKLFAATAGAADAEPLDLRGPPRGAIFAAAAAAAAADPQAGDAAAGGGMPESGAMFAAVPQAAAAAADAGPPAGAADGDMFEDAPGDVSY
jgi:hypothetical protein